MIHSLQAAIIIPCNKGILAGSHAGNDYQTNH
jgi:hypothetical protein